MDNYHKPWLLEFWTNSAILGAFLVPDLDRDKSQWCWYTAIYPPKWSDHVDHVGQHISSEYIYMSIWDMIIINHVYITSQTHFFQWPTDETVWLILRSLGISLVHLSLRQRRIVHGEMSLSFKWRTWCSKIRCGCAPFSNKTIVYSHVHPGSEMVYNHRCWLLGLSSHFLGLTMKHVWNHQYNPIPKQYSTPPWWSASNIGYHDTMGVGHGFLHDLGEHPLGALDTLCQLRRSHRQPEEEPGAGQIAETATNMNK